MAVDIAFDPAAYGAWFDSPLGRRVWADEARALFSVLRPETRWRVLDVGCGDGRLLLSLARQGPRLVGADASVAMLHAARDRARAAGLPVYLVCAEVGALPFADESFDAATAVTVLCFMVDSGPALHEMARTVRRRGQLVIGELGRWSSWAVRRRLEGRLRGGPWSVAEFRSAPALKRLLQAAGLVPGRVRGAVFYPKSSAAARLLGPFDAMLGAITTVGAAFIAIAADKPAADGALLADTAVGENGSNG